MDDQALRAQAGVFKALGHPARLGMVLALAEGERCVCELTAASRLDISTVSKHLAVLSQARVLVSDKRANKVFYRLRTPCLLNVLRCLGEAQRAPDGDGGATGDAACCG